MANKQYTVASTAQLVGVPAEHKYFYEIKAMDYANREKSQLKRKTEVKKGGHAGPPLRTDSASLDDASPGTEVFTHSRHASWSSSSSPTTAIPESLPMEEPKEQTVLLLQPVAYSPPGNKSEAGSLHSSSSTERQTSVSAETNVKDFGAEMDSPTIGKAPALIVDPDASSHVRSPSNGSASSRRRGRRSDGLEIYFTPTDYTKSKIFLSSPQNSPTLTDGQAATEGEDGTITPKVSTSNDRPASEIFVGPQRFGTPATRARQEKLKITPEQLDQLVTALAKSRMIQKDVRKHWWDVDDIPDDETVSSFSAVSIPTLTSASTLYSQQLPSFYSHSTDDVLKRSSSNEKRATIDTQPAKKSPNGADVTPIDAPFGGIALTDPKIHGSPIRFVSQDYRIGANIQTVGTCSYVQVPYGVDVECTLRVEPRSAYSTTSRVMLQCVNQVVDRKTGQRTHLLLADQDVTDPFTTAALAELTASVGKEMTVVSSPTAPSPFQSPDIDWIAIADELQQTSETAALIETTAQSFDSLTPESCHTETSALLSTLERIKDQHSDFLLLRPTAYHPNGIPKSMRLPHVSQRLYRDWYQNENEKRDEGESVVGHSPAAKAFQEQIVAAVAKRSLEGKVFTTYVRWEEERVVVRCVPLSGGEQQQQQQTGRRGTGDVWACFVRGMF